MEQGAQDLAVSMLWFALQGLLQEVEPRVALFLAVARLGDVVAASSCIDQEVVPTIISGRHRAVDREFNREYREYSEYLPIPRAPKPHNYTIIPASTPDKNIMYPYVFL